VHQPGQPHPRVRRQPALTRAGLVYRAGLTDSDGKLEAGPDLIGSAGVDSAHGQQRLCHQCEPGGIPPLPEQRRGQRPRAPQFGLGQLPQVGFRALAVHVLSVSPKHAAAPWPLAWPRYWPPPANEHRAAAEAIRRDADAITTGTLSHHQTRARAAGALTGAQGKPS
jgi:hypothetical protein